MPTAYAISVSRETIERATQRDSRHCMIAEAIKEAHPSWEAITVDLATARWTNPRTKKRYICLTPNEGRNAIIAFDGGLPVEPFDLSFRAVQITPIRDREKGANRGRAQVQVSTSGQHTITGGTPIPMGHLAGGVQSSEQVARTARKRNPVKKDEELGVLEVSSGKYRQYGLGQLARFK
jgi:hypothetical protein